MRTPPAAFDPAVPTEPAPRPSKTRLKQDMHERQALGQALTELPPEQLDALPLSETLREALSDFGRIRSHEARRRQLQYIGKLMRSAPVEPLREAVAAARLGPARQALALHETERWRTRLLEHDDALTEWVAAHPGTDVQQLRSRVRAARREATSAAAGGERKGRAFRELFQFLKQESDHA